ncbi:MAG TPA: sigma-54 dependent transcriptional regulator [Candidatus Acidoferrum sp.]|jgi:two-component system response regulator HydG|nr:sigma-54 dependent transcriptional regulator [Candidatus Acidoferrum sp.]
MILVVIDDDPANIKFARFVLANEDLEIHSATDAQSGLELIRRVRPQIVLLDLVLPGVHGMEVLQKILEFDPGIDVILMTGFYSTESAVEAIQKGAADYFPKPCSPDKLREKISQIKEVSKHRQRSLKLENDLLENFEFDGMIGRSPLMLELFSQIHRIAPHFRSVLVTGPTGVGKELVARALHRLSPGHKGNFVALNCSSISESLAESELFGHVKGAFTGALQDKVGIFEYADGGTAMLDEIGEMPLPLQAKLLRVLQNQELQRVGSPVVRKVNVRVVAATNRDLPEMVSQGKFREDLYFRLCMVELKVPSLAERREDLPLLQRHFLKSFAAQYKKPLAGLTRRAQTLMGRYTWPGNVRELENVIGHACMMAESEVIDVRDLPERIQNLPSTAKAESEEQLSMEQVAQMHAQRVLAGVGGNKARAAEILGISRTYLYELLKRNTMDQGVQDEDAENEESKLVTPKNLKNA